MRKALVRTRWTVAFFAVWLAAISTAAATKTTLLDAADPSGAVAGGSRRCTRGEKEQHRQRREGAQGTFHVGSLSCSGRGVTQKGATIPQDAAPAP